MTREEAAIILDGFKNNPLFSDTHAQAFDMAISALSENKGDSISRQAVENITWEEPSYSDPLNVLTEVREKVRALPSVENKGEPETGHWSRKRKVDAYDIAGVKTWGIKCQCDRCTFTTIVVEDFGYYKYCPNCGARMKGGE